jgi:ubiquinone biosynthesis protein UbiJ
MGVDAIINVLIGVAGVSGGFVGGKRLGNTQAVSMAVDVVELLQAQVEILKQKGEGDATEIADLRGRVGLLESMVTQRAEVGAVHDAVDNMRQVVDRIEARLV